MKYDVIVIGGGLAGLTASLCLAKEGRSVLVLEKNKYPYHKVCGEYVSNEVRPFLEYLGLDLNALGAVNINTFSISNVKGKQLHTKLPLGGFGISRYTLDYALYQLALRSGVTFQFETVLSCSFEENGFTLNSKNNEYRSKLAIGAFGKRSLLDKKLNRHFIHKKSPWVGIKAHYRVEDFLKDEVSLHCFPGGYGGLSMVENGIVNFCYLAHYKHFQHYKSIEAFHENVIKGNSHLKRFFDRASPIFDHPLSIAQISFSKKEKVENHLLVCGDSAGLIHPLCGNGMAMAIHGAQIASKSLLKFLADDSYDRSQMEEEYSKAWKRYFGKRMFFGRKIQSVITNPLLINGLFSLIPNSETILSKIIRQTHGKPILV
ncbi:MAG: NAD(P)/FAD-dependent oxidoreductase [Croceivirga sp.]